MMEEPSPDQGSSSVQARPWSRGDCLALAALSLLACGSLAFLVHSWYDPVSDASMYLLTARAIAAGEGYAYLGEPFYLRAPGLSALVSPFVDPATVDFHLVNLVVSAFGAASVVLFYLYQRPRLGWPLAFGCALLLWCLPGFQRLSNQVLSDVPGAALLLACLCVERWSVRSRSPWRQVLLGLCIGVSTYVRAGLVLLLPAIFLGRLLQRGRREAVAAGATPRTVPAALAFVGTTLLVMAPWSIRNANLDRSLEPVDQTLQYDQTTLILRESYRDPRSPINSMEEFTARVRKRANEAVLALGSLRFVKDEEGSEDDEDPLLAYSLGGLLFASLLIAFLRRREPAEFFVVGSLLVLSIFPNPFLDRYALPVFLFALPAFLELLRSGLGRVAGRRTGEYVPLALLLALAAAVFAPRAGWDELEAQHRERVELADGLRSKLRPDSRLAAPKGWHHLSLLLGRPVHCLLFAIRDLGPRPGVSSIIDKYGVNTIVIVEGDPVSDHVDRMLRDMGAPRISVPGSPEPVAIYRVMP